MKERHRFDVIDQEQLAAQIVAVMEAHFQRPKFDEWINVLRLAMQQACARDGQSFEEALSLFSTRHSNSS
jgi:hypothetical protein